MYGNDRLVELAASSKSYLAVKSPRNMRVLEALKRVDRREFLDDSLMSLVSVNPDIFGEIYEWWETVEEIVKKKMGSKIIVPSEKDIGNVLEKSYDMILELSHSVAKDAKRLEIPVSALAYNDIPLPIGYGQYCSQPSLVALMADLLELKEGHNVMEIGTGCGYHAAITSELVGEKGRLTTIEILPDLAQIARRNLERYFERMGPRIEIVCKDGSKGHPENAPYDRIYFTAGVKMNFNTDEFTDQLNRQDGRFLFPDKDAFNLFTYTDNRVKRQRMGNVSFVELQGE